MEGAKAMEIFNIVKAKGMLPTKIDDLVPLSFIGQAAVSFYRQKIKLMDQLGVTEEQRKATLSDGQDAGEMLLDIETRIGEICLEEEKTKRKVSTLGNGKVEIKPSDEPLKHERLGMKVTRLYQAQQIKKHPDVVEKVKKQARENEDIPTKTAVLSEIRYQREVTARKKKEKELKIPKERPNINEFVDRTIKKIDDLMPDLMKIVGNTQYIERLTKDTLKANLNGLYEIIEKLKKEI